MFEDLDLKVTDEKVVIPGSAGLVTTTRVCRTDNATCSGKYCC